MLRRVGLIGAVIAVAACGGDAAVTPEAQTGLRFTVRSVSDTIETLLAAPLELQLNDDAGAPRSGVAVTVTGPGEPGATRLLTALGTPSQQMVTVTTDATGRARVWARFGGRVGREWVRASAGTSVDSLAVDILVGQLANLIAEPADTAMWVGQSFQIRTQVTDRRNNARSDAVTFTATGDAATVSSTGVITGTAIGRGTVTASVGSRTSTVFASVVPQATLAVYAEAQLLGQDAGIYVIRSDGSGGRWAFKFSSTGSAPQSFGLWPTWSADGKRIVFTHSATLRIIQADGSGLRDLVTPGGPLPVANDYAPQFGKDGWIHFTRGQFGSQRTFWRVREDGSGLVQTSEQRGWGVEAMPTPSPTSDAVAYQTNDITNSPIRFTLRIIASSTGVIRKLDLPGYSPRWSPTGNRIGYLDDPDRLNFLDANGTPLGQVGGRIVPLQPGFSWSSDGAWVIGVGGSTGPVLRIVNTTSGLVLPLAFRGPDRQMLIHPSWQPTP